jgi:hypothetical protein
MLCASSANFSKGGSPREHGVEAGPVELVAQVQHDVLKGTDAAAVGASGLGRCLATIVGRQPQIQGVDERPAEGDAQHRAVERAHHGSAAACDVYKRVLRTRLPA